MANTQPKNLTIIGLILSVLPCFALIGSAVMKFVQPPELLEQLSKIGLEQHLLIPLGVVELVSTILFLIPRTSFLGAILLTGYFGGAIFSHVRIVEPFTIPLALGIVIWVGYGLRHVEDMKLAFHISKDN